MAVLKLKTAPAAFPVSVEEARTQCRVDSNDEDQLLQIYIEAATAHLDGYTGTLGRALITQTWEMFLDAFEDGSLTIPLAPIISVTSVEYMVDGTYTTWASSGNYTSSVVAPFGVITPVNDWPEPDEITNAVRVTFTAGYGATAASVPAPIRAAILIMVADMYENRSAKLDETMPENPTVARLLWPYRHMNV